ncbi:MAG: hypothetical protein RIA64_13090 [Rhodospirillales bacterium]
MPENSEDRLIADTPRTAFWVTLAALAAVKAALLTVLGPVYLPDSSDYVLFANKILNGGDWIHRLDLSAEDIPLTAFRGIGYPALIALYKTLFGGIWDWALILSQFFLSLGATAAIWRLARRLSGRTWVAVIAAMGQGLGLALVLDQCILTDSLHATLLTLVAATLALSLLDGRPPTVARALWLGLILLTAFLLREAGAVMHLALWPLAIAWCLGTGRGLAHAALCFVLFLTPLVLGIQGYKAWNQMRTGERFITTVGETAMYHPVLDLARHGYPVFAEDPLLADADLLPLHPIPGVSFSKIIQHLRSQHSMNALDITRHANALFHEHWRRYPLARTKIVLGRLSPRYAFVPFMPLSGPERLSLWAGGSTPFPAPGEIWRNLFDHGRIDQAALIGIRTLARALSAALTFAFLIGVPLVVIRHLAHEKWRMSTLSRRDLALGTLWLFVTAYPAAYALVYLEDRYLAPVAPFAAVIGLALLAPYAERAVGRIWAHVSRRAG